MVNLEDLSASADIASVQPYVINCRKAVLLQPREPAHLAKHDADSCLGCPRSVRTGFRYCSVRCRVNHCVEETGTTLVVCVPAAGKCGAKAASAVPRVKTPKNQSLLSLQRQSSDASIDSTQ